MVLGLLIVAAGALGIAHHQSKKRRSNKTRGRCADERAAMDQYQYQSVSGPAMVYRDDVKGPMNANENIQHGGYYANGSANAREVGWSAPPPRYEQEQLRQGVYRAGENQGGRMSQGGEWVGAEDGKGMAVVRGRSMREI